MSPEMENKMHMDDMLKGFAGGGGSDNSEDAGK